MPQKTMIKMECTQCKRVGYRSRKNPRIKGRLEKSKHCPFCRKHTPHKETK